MLQVNNIPYKEIPRISPSQFLSMKNCQYKSILAQAFDKKPLLPISVNAYYGSVLHKMLELISNGTINSEIDFDTLFADQVKLMEESLLRDGYAQLVPLNKRVWNFTEKKILAKAHLKRQNAEYRGKVKFSPNAEDWFESEDKVVGGRIDLVISKDSEIEIIDFKTGAITYEALDDDSEASNEIKDEYKDQMKLYAQIYFETTGVFPTKLTLMNLAKEKFQVDFTKGECALLMEDAKKLLINVNESIRGKNFKANPDKANCTFCLYRPACSFYLKILASSDEFKDISGCISSVRKFRNGNVTLDILRNDQTIVISDLPEEISSELLDKKGVKVNVFNLRSSNRDSHFKASKTTVLYEESINE